MKKWNHYKCPECEGITVARHDNEGVTPFMLRCRVNAGCDGMARSCFFECSQEDEQTPHVIFFRPGEAEAAQFIKEQPYLEREWLADHYRKGGALMREV
jgi:hypothetical protein